MADQPLIEQDGIITMTLKERDTVAGFLDQVAELVQLVPAAQNLAKALRQRKPVSQPKACQPEPNPPS